MYSINIKVVNLLDRSRENLILLHANKSAYQIGIRSLILALDNRSLHISVVQNFSISGWSGWLEHDWSQTQTAGWWRYGEQSADRHSRINWQYNQTWTLDNIESVIIIPMLF